MTTIRTRNDATCSRCGAQIAAKSLAAVGDDGHVTHDDPKLCDFWLAHGSTPPAQPTVFARRPAPEAEAIRICWECGRPFTRAQAREHGGDWSESYCGC